MIGSAFVENFKPRMFAGVFKNFILVQTGLVDAETSKGAGELENLRHHISNDVARYAEYMRGQNFYSETVTEVGHDVVETANEVAAEIVKRFPHAVFFGGQLVFAKESRLTRLLHNFAVFTRQRKFFRQGMPFVVADSGVRLTPLQEGRVDVARAAILIG